jgi:hypothetical protein
MMRHGMGYGMMSQEVIDNTSFLRFIEDIAMSEIWIVDQDLEQLMSLAALSDRR